MNPQELVQIIQRDTGLCVESYNLLLDGWDNIVLEVNDAVIFRFTRRREILDQHIKELELLPLLSEHLTLRVPEPIYHQTDDPPYYMAYMKIPGKPVTKEFNSDTIINAFTGFLRELQQIDHHGLQKTPRYTPESWKQEYHELHQRITREAYPFLELRVQSQITKEFNHFQGSSLSFTPTLCHRDLGIEHILESEGRITGIIDWGDACIGDPAFDLTGLLMGFDVGIVKDISDRLGYPPKYLERTRFYSRVAPFYEFFYGRETQDEKHIKTGLEKINKTYSMMTSSK